MKYSKLKNDLEVLELQYKHEITMLQINHEQAKRELLSKCTHTYEDGTSAKVFEGEQWNYHYKCGICGKTI